MNDNDDNDNDDNEFILIAPSIALHISLPQMAAKYRKALYNCIALTGNRTSIKARSKFVLLHLNVV